MDRGDEWRMGIEGRWEMGRCKEDMNGECNTAAVRTSTLLTWVDE